MAIPNSRKLWRMRKQWDIHNKNDFPQAFSMYDSLRIRRLIAEGLVDFFRKLKTESKVQRGASQ